MISQKELEEWDKQLPDEAHAPPSEVPPAKPTSVVVRFKCHSALIVAGVEQVSLMAVYSADPNHTNHWWSKYTPAGSLMLSISNPAAQGVFQIGKEYEILATQVLP